MNTTTKSSPMIQAGAWLRARIQNVLSVVRVERPEPEMVPVPVRPGRVHRVIVALAAVALVAATAASAGAAVRYRATDAHWQADGRLVDVQVKVDGRTAPLFFKPGARDRHYMQALEGRNYSLVIRNTTGRRVAVLIAVDGLNVVNGERSNTSRHEPMYVLGPWEEAEIQGWRTSLRDIRRFVFVDEQRSYAERTGQANGDMGWIRVLSFNEVQPRVQLWRAPEPQRGGHDRDDGYGNNAPAPSGGEAPRARSEARGDRQTLESEGGKGLAGRESNPGTGWGDHQYDPVQRTTFNPVAYATDTIVLRYEYASGLRALGIFPRHRSRTWERERGQLGFAQPPRW